MSEGTDERATSRARFLGGAAVLAGMAAGAGALAREGKSADGRSYVAGNFMLDLDGVKSGFLKSVDGGGIKADVIEEPAGEDYYAKKHIGQPKYEEFEIQIGAAMSKAVYDWISTSWQGSHTRKSGSVIAADFQLNAVAQRDFFDALLTEVTIPAADAGSKDPAYMTLKFAPELTRKGKPSGGKLSGPGKGEQKQWLPSNFRLTIGKLDCSKVSKIDSFTIKQTVATDDVGSERDYAKEPGKLEFPNLSITMSETGIADWEAWHEDFVIQGNNGQESEKNGSLVFLSSNRADELLEIKFFNLGIFKLAPDKAEANSDQVKRWTAELYCERMEFVYKAGATG